MGFLDKAKEAAEKAKNAAQQAAQQGQDKIGEMKAERAEGSLLKTLGEAVYAEQRHAGSHEAVEAALKAIDTHHTEVAAAAAAEEARQAAAKAAGTSTDTHASHTGSNTDTHAAHGTDDIVDAVIVED